MQTDDTHCFNYVACDIPPGMTLAAWRKEKARAARRSARRRTLRRLFGRA